ncbi:MAG: hypothetical protein LBG96_05350 [Tannerella sp.]|jgi:hypothetical protein|nr:hypothetical protein [Tannerella sp.]
MKKILFTCFVFISLAAIAQDTKVAWDYPIKPGMKEWKKFTSNEEMVNACQIPEKILSALSTEDLMELCLQYPLIYDVFAFENLNHGLDKLFGDFNGIRELYRRPDISNSLTNRYVREVQDFSFLDSRASDIEKGYFIMSVSAMEVLLASIERSDNTGKEDHRAILQNLVSGYEAKSKYADYFKGFGFQTNFYSRSRLISKMDKLSIGLLPHKDKNAVLLSGMADAQSINIIDNLSYQLIK